MTDENSLEDAVDKLKREIALLEWDLPNIKNNALKSAREQKLASCKQELQRLKDNQKLLVLNH